MTNAREVILGRVRAALAEADRSEVHVPTAYRSRPEREGDVERFVERVEDYRATVTRVPGDDPAAVVDAIVAALPDGGRVVVPSGLPWDLTGRADTTVDSNTATGAGGPDGDGRALSSTELDGYAAVVTAAAVGIAETGTIVLTHEADQGRRAISLVPDLHVCVVRVDQVVPDVPAAFRRLDPGRPQTWISGPSATSDIELNRVEGVHGPRTLHVLLVG
ncbi:LutC/YkgG family protein [Nocardioides mesophilus]|uniref:LUD domain-containing protein n=1 Tax=Nocardioides mesophilus TaxID=433659 RepID=A0A7G9RE99_9ACTN|nr:LUD domain-containing protein [Nocardioides mesophilus]QNN53924.1 LUD domain-containing protein [Nocardioides mesophilus]